MMLDPNILTDPLFIITIAAAIVIFTAHIYYGWISLDIAFLLAGSVFILAGAVTDYLDDNDWVG